MNDIPSLIERLTLCLTPPGWEWKEIEPLLRDILAELSRLAALPLPEEIAGLATDLLAVDIEPFALCAVRKKAAAALQRLAGEVERLSEDNESFRSDVGELEVKNERSEARIAELEAERDAIKAKTIEECDALIAQFAMPDNVRRELRQSIRALNQPEAGGENR